MNAFVRKAARRFFFILSIFTLASSISWAVNSNHEYDFKGTPDGEMPYSGLVSDGAGNFYGVTPFGGNIRTNNDYACGMPGGSCGTVFKISPGQSGGWQEEVIYKFTGDSDGALPYGKLVLDSQGNLYGTTTSGGSYLGCTCGTVFELMPQVDGTWKETTLYAFHGGSDAAAPFNGVVFDAQGNLYGSAECVAPCGGTVFEMSPGQGGVWSESVIYTFLSGVDGNGVSQITLDGQGNIYGTTPNGGTPRLPCNGGQGCGTVFELIKSGNGTWSKQILYSFNAGLDGNAPDSGVTFDNAGNLYGETPYGGSLACPVSGCGVIYRLTPQSGGIWNFSVVHTFNGLYGSKGNSPDGGLTFDSSGALYGTTVLGGNLNCRSGYGCGTVFKLTHSTGQNFAFQLIKRFDDTHGSLPSAGITVDSGGKLYGTTRTGGDFSCTSGCGTIFVITP